MSEDLRENIITIASDKMNQLGIRSVSIDDICRDMGISKKTFYVYFATKDDLVDAVLHRQEQEIERNTTKELERENSVLNMIVRNIQIVQRAKKILQPPPFLFDLQKYYPALFAAHKENMFASTQQFLSEFLQKGVDEGVLDSEMDIKMTTLFLARLHQGLLEALAHPDREREEFTKMCQHGMKLIAQGMITAEGKRRIEEMIAKKQSKEDNNDKK